MRFHRSNVEGGNVRRHVLPIPPEDCLIFSRSFRNSFNRSPAISSSFTLFSGPGFWAMVTGSALFSGPGFWAVVTGLGPASESEPFAYRVSLVKPSFSLALEIGFI